MFMQKPALSESNELIADMEAVSLLTDNGSVLIVSLRRLYHCIPQTILPLI